MEIGYVINMHFGFGEPDVCVFKHNGATVTYNADLGKFESEDADSKMVERVEVALCGFKKAYYPVDVREVSIDIDSLVHNKVNAISMGGDTIEIYLVKCDMAKADEINKYLVTIALYNEHPDGELKLVSGSYIKWHRQTSLMSDNFFKLFM